ncbi:hypothetical protein B566_EDAN012336 [Ephemera danica]|nr:hypothetical protein B566_EDAN012336 [Ephemera danica]
MTIIEREDPKLEEDGNWRCVERRKILSPIIQKPLFSGTFTSVAVRFLALSPGIRSTDDRSNKVQREQPLPLEYEDLGSPGPGVEEEDQDDIHVYQGVRGRAGIDFPMLRRVPKTSFSCRKMKTSGYFADLDTGCQVFHLCEGGRKMSFLCPNGTIFRQSKLTCDWWFKVDCPSSEEFYESSAEQLRHDRASPGNSAVTPTPHFVQEERGNKQSIESRERITTTTARIYNDRGSDEVVTSTPRYQEQQTSTPANVVFNQRDETSVNSHVSQRLSSTGETLSRRHFEESQEVAETGSFIIPRHQQEISSTSQIKATSYNIQQSYDSRPTFNQSSNLKVFQPILPSIPKLIPPNSPNQQSQTYPTQETQTYPNQQSQTYPTQQSQTYPNQQSQTYPTQQTHPTQEFQTYPNQQSQTYPTQQSQSHSNQQSQTYPTQQSHSNQQSQTYPTQQTHPTQQSQSYSTRQSQTYPTDTYPTEQAHSTQQSVTTDFASTTQEPVTESYVIPERRLELPTTTRRPEFTTFTPEVTTEQVSETTRVTGEYTTRADSTWDDTPQVTETLQGSHSQWYGGAPTTNFPYTTQEDFNYVSFFTAPDTTLLPPTEQPIIQPLAGTERAARGFAANPRPRPGLSSVPLAASPLTLHSLAKYFAADNATRKEIEKEVPPATMKLMESLVPQMEATTVASQKPSPDLRQLAQIFSKALADYLEDPEGFRQTLSSVRPTDAPPLHNFVDEEKDEVLDYSDTVNTKRPRTTTTELPETTTTEYPVKNEVASIVNEILQEPTARKVPDNLLVHEETQYRFSTPNYLPESSVTTTDRTLENTVAENIPAASSTAYPITPDTIPEIASDKFAYSVPEYVEIGYQKASRSHGGYFEPEPIDVRGRNEASLQAVLQHFAPHDLNSLAVFSVDTNPSPVEVSIHTNNPSPTPVSVAVHIPPQTKNIHRVTVLTSSHNTQVSKHGTTYRPMISKLLFPLPTVTAEKRPVEYGESLVSENTASFPPSFRNAQSLIQASKERILKSWLNEDKSVSQLLTETIPTTPATTNEPVTEDIPTTVRPTRPGTSAYLPESHDEDDLAHKTGVEYATTSTPNPDEEVPTGRRVNDEGGQKLVLLLVKNGVAAEPSEDISRNKLLQALLEAGRNTSAEATEATTTTTESITTTTTEEPVTVTSSPPPAKKILEVTTYRSAQHERILERVRESAEVQHEPRAEPLVQAPPSLPGSLESASTHHPQSRALGILKSLYSLASRWG